MNGGGIIRWGIGRPVSVAVGVILVVLFGALSVFGIPIQLTPDVTVPTISVSTTWPGATPSEIEADILEDQEEALKSLPGLVRMTSEARRNVGTITLELEVGSSLQEGLVRVNNLLSQVPSYPLNARQPVVRTGDAGGQPLAVVVIQSDPPGRPVEEYKTWIDDVLVPQLERIRGVASIRVTGGREQEVHIDFDPRALAARGITLSQVAAAVRTELADISAGDISIGKRRYVVRTLVTPPAPEELERVVLTTDALGSPVALGDVARVSFGLRKREAIGLVNGAPSTALLFFREAGSNVLEVTQEIRAVVAELQERYLAPEGLEMRIVSDQVEYITGALDLVKDNLLTGAALAVLVLLVFLRSLGASAVVAISIPISVVGTVLLMSLMGRTINIVSLAGMAFAVGLVVDASIVVLENIDTWRQRTGDIANACLSGTREVWGAIFASTLTTAAVFIPIITWQDEVGELLRDVAVAITTAVFVSLVVSVVVIPSFAARLLRARGKAVAQSSDAPEDFGRVGRAVHFVVRRPLRSVLVGIGGIAASATLGLALVPPMEYLPTGNRNVVFGIVIPPPGYAVDEMSRIGEHLTRRLNPHLGADKDGVAALDRWFFVGSPDQAFLGAVAEDPKRVGEVAGLIRQVLREVPDLIGFANQGSLFGRNVGGSRVIEIDLASSSLEDMVSFGGRLMGELQRALPGSQVRPVPGLDLGAPEFQVEPNRAELARYGVNSSELGLLVDAYVDGAMIGELGRAGEPKRDVILRGAGLTVDGPSALAAAPAAVPGGRQVPVGQLVSIEERLGPTIIQHIERRRAISLQVSPPDHMALEEALDIVRDQVVGPLRDAGEVPPGLRVDYSGSAGKLEETKARFFWVLLLAVIISYLLLSALFEDFLAPLAILVTVPLAGAGGVVGLRLVDALLGAQSLDMMTALGFVILIGVVVNNAILVVDGSLNRMRAGASLPDAVALAVRWRVRPIFMTTLTSLAGLLPLVVISGFGSELYRGIGGVVLGGLAFSTVLSLFLVPAVFTSLWRLRALVVRSVARR